MIKIAKKKFQKLFNKTKKEKNRRFSKKSVCAACVFLFALSDPVLLCGCASARDGITMTLGSAEAPDNNMTEVSFPDRAAGTGGSGGIEGTEGTEGIKGMNAYESEPPQVYIYVCGAVVLPGVYSLEQGSRLYEAVELAGGLTADADENCLNMARQIADGEQVVVLTQEEALALKEAGTYAYPPGDTLPSAAQASGLVNINTATVTELTTVSGIGAGRAQAIVDYREKNGSFGSIEEIKRVDGIKDGLFKKIKDKITI